MPENAKINVDSTHETGSVTIATLFEAQCNYGDKIVLTAGSVYTSFGVKPIARYLRFASVILNKIDARKVADAIYNLLDEITVENPVTEHVAGFLQDIHNSFDN